MKFLNTIDGNLSGNSSSSAKLQTPRKINGVPFDGSSDITVYDGTKVGVTYKMNENPPDNANSYSYGHIWINGTTGRIWIARGDEIQCKNVFEEVTSSADHSDSSIVMHYVGIMTDAQINAADDYMDVHGVATSDNDAMPYKEYWHVWKYRWDGAYPYEEAKCVNSNTPKYFRQCCNGTWGEWKQFRIN